MKLISVNRRSLFEVSFIILLTYHKKRIHLVGQKQVYTGNTLTYCSTAFGWNLDEYYLCQIPLKLRQQFNHYHLHDFETRWNIYDSKAPSRLGEIWKWCLHSENASNIFRPQECLQPSTITGHFGKLFGKCFRPHLNRRFKISLV